jgi:hypothetical protein
MKLDANFITHWKTERLLEACGPTAVLGLLRLWGDAQNKRQWRGLTLNPRKLAAIMRHDGDADALWAAMTDKDSPWLDEEPEGKWAIHGFDEHNRQLLHLWEAGRKGGRPSKDNTNTDKGRVGLGAYANHMVSSSPSTEKKDDEETISKPFANHMVSVVTTPTLEEFKIAASMMGVEEAIAEEVWHDNESRAIAPTGEWTDWNGRPIANWRSNLKARAAQIARKRPSKALTKPKGVWDAKQGIDALQTKLERMKANPKFRRHKAETPWETEWTPEAKAEVTAIRAKIRELEGVVAA